MAVLTYPLTRILLAFVTGILIARFFTFPLESILLFLTAGIVFTLALLLLKAFKQVWVELYGIAAMSLFVTLGILAYSLTDGKHHSNHFLNQQQGASIFSFTVEQSLKPTDYYYRQVISVTEVDGKETTGNVLLKIKKEKGNLFSIDSVYTAFGSFDELPVAMNPGDFDYGRYLRDQGIAAQMRADRMVVISSVSASTDLMRMFYRFRESGLTSIDKMSYGERQKGMVKALLIGERGSLDEDVVESFRNAGVVHILALSGLHVGIILLILRFFTNWVKRWRWGHIAQSVLLIILLWGYGILSGLSPSILRAVTMFSFVAIGMNMKRDKSTMMSVIASAFILLLIDPKLLFQVGFQLSYAAVFAILGIQPLLYKLYRPRTLVDNTLWSVFTVTVSAQIGVAPLSIYYFHQFPGIFLVANLLLLWFLPFLMGGMLLTVVLQLLDLSVEWLVQVVDRIIGWIIDAVTYLGNIRFLLFEDLFLTIAELAVLYLLIFSIIQIVQLPSARQVYRFGVVMLTAGLVLIGFELFQSSLSSYIRHDIGCSSLVYVAGKNQPRLYHHADEGFRFRESDIANSIQNAQKTKNVELMGTLPRRFRLNGKTITRIDSTGIYIPKKTDLVWLCFSPRIHLERVVKELKPSQIIVDGSNYPSEAEQWKKTAGTLNTSFAYTGDAGAIRF